MKLRQALPMTLLALAASLPAGAQTDDWKKINFPPLNELKIPEPQRTTLPNGMLVMLLEDHELPTVSVMTRIRTGSRTVAADKTGLSDVFGDVLRTGGTKTMTGDQIDDFLETR